VEGEWAYQRRQYKDRGRSARWFHPTDILTACLLCTIPSRRYLSGSKVYRAGGELGFETTTLDMEGNVTKRAPYDHVTPERLRQVLPSFTGTIQQVPPIFSAIRRGGKKLYEEARNGVSADDVQIDPREVRIDSIELTDASGFPPKFEIVIECGGGTYVRSLIRDIGYELDSVATTTLLERTKQGQFTIDGALRKDDWSADAIYDAIERFNDVRGGAGGNT